MEVLKVATDWAKAEVFSTLFFIFFAVLFLIASVGFWQLGKTDVAKAYVFPMLTAGVLLLTIGLGLFYTNKTRINQFETDYQKDASAFKIAEIVRAERTLNEYKTVVFKAIPIIIIVATLLIVFTNGATWRAISITTIAMMIVILLIDSNAHARIKAYHEQLISATG